MTRDHNRDEEVAALLATLETPPPPPDFFARFWRRVDAERHAQRVPVTAAVSSIGDSMSAQPALAHTALLRKVQMMARGVVEISGGSDCEADAVADEIVLYVDFHWTSLRLNVLAQDPRAWEQHILRQIYRCWLSQLRGKRGQWTTSGGNSLARARLLALADSASLHPMDRALIDHILVYGFSLAETAYVFGIDPTELSHRLRHLWVQVGISAGRGASSDHTDGPFPDGGS